ncbi:DUF397 domain-containing protein [Nocardiopsis chromatogenes]|uniref:DUF397 domain-containing protein n=1 Tax=Nocardiopsis chromatogenes TaxID=280239 RepID=UPI0003449210|nr:DUF397 domain-containing protein [Nocardiopsis chromatogenes]
MSGSDTPPLAFRKSSYSGAKTENCVEVADLPRAAAVRDSQYPERGHLLFGSTEWRAFLYEVKRDRL